MKKLVLKYHFWVMGIVTLLINSCSTTQKTVKEKGATKIYNLKYGEHKKNVMDVFLPEDFSQQTPVVMLIHGGAWKVGRKEHLRKIQDKLFRENIPTVNIGYRLVKKETTYKQQLEDIAKAIDKTKTEAIHWNINPENLILLGESAGGHLALLYGYKNPNEISKLISLSGPTDFYSEEYLNSNYSKYTSPTFQDVVGVKFNRKELSDEFREASPIAHISNVPTLIFQGDKDLLVNKNQGLKLNSLLTEKEVPHRLIFMENTGHVPRFFNKKKRDSIIYPEIINWIKN